MELLGASNDKRCFITLFFSPFSMIAVSLYAFGMGVKDDLIVEFETMLIAYYLTSLLVSP